MGSSNPKCTNSRESSKEAKLMLRKYEFTKDYKPSKNNIKNLVFEGGGVKGIAYCGCLKALDDYNLLSQVTSAIGTSAGSAIALMVILGFTPEEIYKELINLDYEKFKDDSFGFIRDLFRLKNHFGWHKGESLRKHYHQLIGSKTGNSDITFEQLHRRNKKTLVVTGTSVTKHKTHFFSHMNSEFKDMRIADALRISMSIPYYFTPVHYKGELMIDGGITANFPLTYFDDKGSSHEETLGFILFTPDEFDPEHRCCIDKFTEFSSEVVNTLLKQIERYETRGSENTRMVKVNTADVCPVDFCLSERQINYLSLQGYVTTIDFLESKGFIAVQNKAEVQEMRDYCASYLKEKGLLSG